MRIFSSILITLFISLFTTCVHGNKKMLEVRANYIKTDGSQIDSTKIWGEEEYMRKAPVVKKAWLHAHPMSASDYFGGGFIYFTNIVEEWVKKDFPKQ